MFSRLYKKLVNWHHWPFYLFYFPISPAWLWYFLKSRSLWFYTGSNPTLAFGGFEGERKTVMYRQLPPDLCPATVLMSPAQTKEEGWTAIEQQSIRLPFIVKPDIGMKGILFRKIETREQWEAYHRQMPFDYLVQEYLGNRLEVSVFYCRLPSASKGTITAFIQKNLMELEGDGIRNLPDMLEGKPYAGELLKNARQYYPQWMHQAVPKGVTIPLSLVANLFHGASFIDLHNQVTPAMQALFDSISHTSKFYYGRYDIKVSSIENMKAGKDFHILEFNGAGSVPNHIYAGRFSLPGAYREILRHWRYMLDISQENRKKGFTYLGLGKGHRFLSSSKAYFRRLKELDRQIELPAATPF